jgi:hypothetical protein
MEEFQMDCGCSAAALGPKITALIAGQWLLANVSPRKSTVLWKE